MDRDEVASRLERACPAAFADEPVVAAYFHGSIFLGWAVATGAAGSLTYLFLIGTAIGGAARRVAVTVHGDRRLVAAFVAVLVSYLTQGLFSVDVPPLALMGWVGLGDLAVLLGPHVEVSNNDEMPRGRRVRWVAVVAVALALLVAGFRPLRADRAMWEAERRASRGWSRATLDAYLEATRLLPTESAYHGLLAAYFDRIAGDPSSPYPPEEALFRALDHYQEAHALQPRNLYFMLGIAEVHARLGEEVDPAYFEQGAGWLDRAAAEDGLDPEIHDVYADYLGRWARHAKDRSIVRRARAESSLADRLRADVTPGHGRSASAG